MALKSHVTEYLAEFGEDFAVEEEAVGVFDIGEVSEGS